MRSGASTIGRPHCAGCRDIHVCSTPVHQERIILAAHSFDTSVAHTHLKRTTPAHPEPARVETATCPLDGRFHSTDRPGSQEARSMGPCGVHVQRMNSGHPWSAWIARQGRGSHCRFTRRSAGVAPMAVTAVSRPVVVDEGSFLDALFAPAGQDRRAMEHRPQDPGPRRRTIDWRLDDRGALEARLGNVFNEHQVCNSNLIRSL